MAGALPVPRLSRIAEIPEFLGRLQSLGAWGSSSQRSWSGALGAGAPERSFLAAMGGPGPARSEVEGPILALADAEPLARRVGERGSSLAPALAPSALRGLRFAAEELAANVAQHARAGGTGFVSVGLEGTELTLWVSDCGIGIEASLRENPEFSARIAGAAEAIVLAVERGVTREPGRGNMGIGLRFVSEFAPTAGGEIAIVSGDAFWRRKAGPSGAAPAFVERVAPWRGTIVALRIPVRGSPAETPSA